MATTFGAWVAEDSWLWGTFGAGMQSMGSRGCEGMVQVGKSAEKQGEGDEMGCKAA